jgi:hypothetical protein
MLLAVRAEARRGCADALALAPSPAVGPAVAGLLGDAQAAVCVAALSVLRFRRQVPYAVVLPFLAHPHVEVAGAAARALAAVPESTSAAAVLRYVLSREPSDALAVAVAEALLTLGDPSGLSLVRRRLEAESAAPTLADDVRVSYLRLLALAGDASDRDLFVRSLSPTPRDADAGGWFGHPDVVDWLLSSLEAGNEARRGRGHGAPSLFETAAARALHRILGSPTGGTGRDAVVADAGHWRSHVNAERARVPSGKKLRFGRLYTPGATLDELEAATLPPTRAFAALELAIVSHGAALLETGDWVARQRATLARARASIGGADRWPAGTFAGARLAEA